MSTNLDVLITEVHSLVSFVSFVHCVAGDLREMQGELKKAEAATAALANVGGDAQAQADSMAKLCAKLTKEVEGLAKQLGTCKQRATRTDECGKHREAGVSLRLAVVSCH